MHSVKIDNFSWRYIKRDCITVKKLVFSSDFSNISKNEQFSLENHWSVQDLTGKTSFWWYFSQIAPNGGKLSLEKGYFMKIYNISMKHTERDSICLKKLVFLLKQAIFHEKASVSRRLSFENWLKSVISLKLADFMKIYWFSWRYTER